MFKISNVQFEMSNEIPACLPVGRETGAGMTVVSAGMTRVERGSKKSSLCTVIE